MFIVFSPVVEPRRSDERNRSSRLPFTITSARPNGAGLLGCPGYKHVTPDGVKKVLRLSSLESKTFQGLKTECRSRLKGSVDELVFSDSSV